VYLNPVHFLQRKEAYAKRMEAMLNYAQSEWPCRSKQLLAYFGEGKAEDCGICDVCIGRQQGENAKETFYRIADSIREQLRKGPVHVHQIDLLFSESTDQVMSVLRSMTDSGEVILNGDILQNNNKITK